MKNTKILATAAVVAIAAGCAHMGGSDDGAATRAKALAMMKASFKEHGQAKLDRLDQDELQKACSQAHGQPLDKDVAERLEKAQLATVKYPADGKLMGDWKAGERLAQTGVGMQYSDDPKAPTAATATRATSSRKPSSRSAPSVPASTTSARCAASRRRCRNTPTARSTTPTRSRRARACRASACTASSPRSRCRMSSRC